MQRASLDHRPQSGRRRGLRVCVTAVTLLAGLIVGVVGSGTTPVRALVGSSNADRQALLDSYNAEFGRIEPASEWTGAHSTCSAGTTAENYRASVLSRVNWYRRTSGLSEVSYDSAAQSKVQAAALYQSVAGKLSHYIEAGTPCYSAQAAQGSETSNLALGAHGTRAVDMYIVDPGANNAAVGHRRWIMSPTLKAVATGDVAAGDGTYAANALSVVGDTVPSVVPVGTSLTWPSAGYFPDALVPVRWSFTTAAESGTYTNATVTVIGPDGPVPTTVEYTSGGVVVFQPSVSSRVSADTTYRVNISDVTGTSQSSYSYDVTLIDANESPRFSGSSGFVAATCSSIGTNIVSPVIVDDGTTTLSLVPGVGDNDNGYFFIDERWVSVAGELPLERTSYQVRVRATDDKGAAVEDTLRITLTDANDASVACPVRGLALSEEGGKVVASWGAPHGLVGNLFYVYSDPSGGSCRTTGLSCTMSGLSAGQTYTFSAYHVRGEKWSEVTKTTYTVAGGGTGVTPKPVTLKRGVTYSLAKLMTVPGGTKRYLVTGPCKLNRSHTKLTALKRRGRCTVKITATSRQSGTKKTTVKKKTFTVK